MKEGLHNTEGGGTFYHAHTRKPPTKEFVDIINSTSYRDPKVTIKGIEYRVGSPDDLGNDHDEPLDLAWNIPLEKL